MEEIRLMESRKSLRLMESHDVDFARLAEGGHVHTWSANGPTTEQLQQQQQQQQHRKRNCSNSTSGIDVPGAYVGWVTIWANHRENVC